MHHDPYDITRVWVRDRPGGGWITCLWKHLNSSPAPFGQLAWDHALASLRERGTSPAESEIAAAAAELMARAHAGPGAGAASKRERRIAARTRAAGASLADTPAAPLRDTGEQDEPDEQWAEVVPLPIFDAREEAKRWW